MSGGNKPLNGHIEQLQRPRCLPGCCFKRPGRENNDTVSGCPTQPQKNPKATVAVVRSKGEINDSKRDGRRGTRQCWGTRQRWGTRHASGRMLSVSLRRLCVRILALSADKKVKVIKTTTMEHKRGGGGGSSHTSSLPPHLQHLNSFLPRLCLFFPSLNMSACAEHQRRTVIYFIFIFLGTKPDLPVWFPCRMRAHGGTWPSWEPPAQPCCHHKPPIVVPFAEKNAADCGGVGTDGTAPCVTVNGRLAAAAAPGLQPH